MDDLVASVGFPGGCPNGYPVVSWYCLEISVSTGKLCITMYFDLANSNSQNNI